MSSNENFSRYKCLWVFLKWVMSRVPSKRHIVSRDSKLTVSSFDLFQFLTGFSVKLPKPWTSEIFMAFFLFTRRKPSCSDCDWSLHNQHFWSFSSVHSFLTLTVNLVLHSRTTKWDSCCRKEKKKKTKPSLVKLSRNFIFCRQEMDWAMKMLSVQ